MTCVPQWIAPLELSMTATLGKVNVYLVQGAGRPALVDTGMNDATSRKELEAALARHGLAPRDIETVVCTHHHMDHAGLGETFVDNGAKVLMSASDARSLELFFSSPELDVSRASFHGRHNVPVDFAERVNVMFPLFRRLATRFAPTQLVADGAILELAGHPFEAMLTPGHTMGHLCLRSKEAPFLLTGDCVLASHATHVSMRSETEGQDPLGAFLASLDQVAGLGVSVGLPGHGPWVHDLPLRCQELRALHEERLDTLARSLGETPRGAFELSQELMGPRPKVFAMWLALSQTLGYLAHLCALGLAREVCGPAGSVLYLGVTADSTGTTGRAS